MVNKVEMIVRHYVKKFLAEAVSDLERLVERKVQEKLDLMSLLQEQKSRSMKEVFDVGEPQSRSTSQRKRITPEMLGVTEDTWKNIYADTAMSSNPILTEDRNANEEPPADRPEHVPEHVMEQAGFMQDFSKHMAAFEKLDKRGQASEEDLEAYNKRKEMLNKNIVRG